MLAIAAWVIVYCAAASASIVLLGDRTLLSGNLFSVSGIMALVTNWRFVTAMALALVARLSFTMVNAEVLKMPRLQTAATTITTFVTAISFLAIVAANVVFLKERLTLNHGIGALLVIIGIGVMSLR